MRKPTVEIVRVTPSMAKKMLKRNTQNRRTNAQMLNKMVRDLKTGNWILTNIGIGIDVNGVVTDGGHRLLGIIKSGIPAEVAIFKNLDPKARDVVDTGTKRSFASSLEMNDLCCTRNEDGIVTSQNNYTKIVGSASSYIILHQLNKFSKVSGVGSVLTNAEVVDFVKENEVELTDSAEYIMQMIKGKNHIYPHRALLLFVYQMHKLFDEPRAQEFVEIVCDRKMPEDVDGCPAIRLKEVLIREYGKSKGRLGTKALLGIYVDAANKFMANIYTKRLNPKGRKTDINNVKFVGELNNKATKFFNNIDYSLHTS